MHCLAYSDKDQLDGRYVDTTAAPNTEYFYQVIAFNAKGDSSPAALAGTVVTNQPSPATGVTLTPTPASSFPAINVWEDEQAWEDR